MSFQRRVFEIPLPYWEKLNQIASERERKYQALTGKSGRQLVCIGHGGRIDLLCFDRKNDRYVVIELKNVRAGQNTYGQICTYMGWVEEHIAGTTPVMGLVISRGCDVKFESALRVSKGNVVLLNVKQLGFR